jgi:Fe2+ or Zn2+ uptake regulation protein
MSKKEDLTPELKAMFTIIDESGEKGTGIVELFDKLEKDYNDTDTLSTVLRQLGELEGKGYVHGKRVEIKGTERWAFHSMKWFAAGKGGSVKEASPPAGVFEWS